MVSPPPAAGPRQLLATTGALLPLLPVLGFWILPTRVDYSLLMLAVGLLYSGLAVTRRSFGFGLLAIAATNGACGIFSNTMQATACWSIRSCG